MADLLKNPIFNDETAPASGWKHGFGRMARPARIAAMPIRPDLPLEGKAHRPGLYQCDDCREQFTVTVKTVFERSNIPLTKWLPRVPDDRQQERRQRPPAPPHAGRQLQINVVHDASPS